MNNANPLIPQGSTIESNPSSRSRVRFAVFCVLAAHLVLLGTLLVVQGCKREETPPPAVANTNPPPPIIESNAAANDFGSLPGNPATNPGAPLIAEQPPATPPAVPVGAAQDYTVVKGDNFYDIAGKFNVPMKSIADANPTVDPNKLQINQKLVIPAPPAAPVTSGAATEPATVAGETLYKVKSGDTLTKIAADHGVTIKALRAANNLTTDRIKVGQSLKIPAKAAGGTTP